MVTPASVTATANGVAGSYAVTASTNAGSGSFALTNTKVQTALALTSSLNPSIAGQSVTFTATLTGAVNPGGTVTFSVDGGTAVAATSATFTASGGTATLHHVRPLRRHATPSRPSTAATPATPPRPPR